HLSLASIEFGVSPASGFLMLPSPPTSTLFPYTTLFRSYRRPPRRPCWPRPHRSTLRTAAGPRGRWRRAAPPGPPPQRWAAPPWRSEEHTSELQSRENLVCRLLLEKKNETQARYAQKDPH